MVKLEGFTPRTTEYSLNFLPSTPPPVSTFDILPIL